MASQIIRYKELGFNAKVDPLQLWTAALSQQMVVDDGAPQWVKEMGEYWREEALYGFSVVAVHLDEELEERDDEGGERGQAHILQAS